MVDGMKAGDVESANKAIRALYSILRYAAGSQGLDQFQKNYYEGGMTLMQHFMESIENGAISIVPGSHTQVEDDDDTISQSSYEQHWQDKGKSFYDDVAKSIGEFKRLEDIANSLKEKNKIEKKAAAFDEIAGEMSSVYQAVHALDGSFDSDNDRNNVPYATMRAMFSLGIVAEIIRKTKEDVAL